MPEETKHGTPTPPESRGRGGQIECTEFEALLTHVLDDDGLEVDGQLSPARKESFEAHRRICGVCGPLVADVKAGRQWLRSLAEVEPPAYLVHNILTATSGVASTRTLPAVAGARTTPFAERAREWWDSMITPATAFVRQPRFVMSFGMIFFSFSLALSAAGVKPKDVAKVDLRPAALRHAYNDAQIKVVKYYDNIRFVYEIESKVRELKRATTPAEPAPQQQKDHKNDTSGQPEQRQDRNYSMEQGETILAALHGPDEICTREAAGIELGAASEHGLAPDSELATRSHSPAVMLTTNRRFV